MSASPTFPAARFAKAGATSEQVELLRAAFDANGAQTQKWLSDSWASLSTNGLAGVIAAFFPTMPVESSETRLDSPVAPASAEPEGLDATEVPDRDIDADEG